MLVYMMANRILLNLATPVVGVVIWLLIVHSRRALDVKIMELWCGILALTTRQLSWSKIETNRCSVGHFVRIFGFKFPPSVVFDNLITIIVEILFQYRYMGYSSPDSAKNLKPVPLS